MGKQTETRGMVFGGLAQTFYKESQSSYISECISTVGSRTTETKRCRFDGGVASQGLQKGLSPTGISLSFLADDLWKFPTRLDFFLTDL